MMKPPPLPRGAFALLVLLSFAPPAHGRTTLDAYLKASNTGEQDAFGSSVAISGDTLVVGAPFEASAAYGIDQNQADNSAISSGAVYVFVRSGTSWRQQAYLKASNTESGDQFGGAVAISGDTVVVGAAYENSPATGVNGSQGSSGATHAGAAYVFIRTGTTWAQQAYLKASNTGAFDYFGSSVAVSGDTVVVGAVYESSGATGVNGNQSDNSVLYSGAAYVFSRAGTAWAQQAYLKASNTRGGEDFGRSVAVSGDTIVVGAPEEDSGATGVNGEQQSEAAEDAGAAYVFTRNGTQWIQRAYLKASNTGAGDSFGGSVAISGDTIVVGAPSENSAGIGVNGSQQNSGANNSGAAYVFTRNGTIWSQQAYLKASNTGVEDYFGSSVAIDGERIVVGAPSEEGSATGVSGFANQADNSAPYAGAAYAFQRIGTVSGPPVYLKAGNTGAGDYFAASVAVSGETAVTGAHGESSAATGINGDQANNSASLAGAAYVFTVFDANPTPPEIQIGTVSRTSTTLRVNFTSYAGLLGWKCWNSTNLRSWPATPLYDLFEPAAGGYEVQEITPGHYRATIHRSSWPPDYFVRIGR